MVGMGSQGQETFPPFAMESTEDRASRYLCLAFVRGSYHDQSNCVLAIGTLVPRHSLFANYSFAIYDEKREMLLWSAIDERFNTVEFAAMAGLIHFGIPVTDWILFPDKLTEQTQDEAYRTDLKRLSDLISYHRIQGQVPEDFKTRFDVKS